MPDAPLAVTRADAGAAGAVVMQTPFRRLCWQMLLLRKGGPVCTIVVADRDNSLPASIQGQVTTLAGGSEAGTADGAGAGAGARFNQPFRLALDERGLLLVAELNRWDTLRVVEAQPTCIGRPGGGGSGAGARGESSGIREAA